MEYTANAASPLVNGEVKLTIGEDALTAAALFDIAEIPFYEVNGIGFIDYRIVVKAESGDYIFSRMGHWGQPFYDALCEAYNKAVLRALFVKGSPRLTARGSYRHGDRSGTAPVHVYEDCVVVLPPDLGARRIPLCFIGGMEKGDYELTLRMDTGETYTHAKLGYDTAPFASAVEGQIRKLRENALAAIKELDPGLTIAQATQLLKVMPGGSAAPLGQIGGIAPSFVAALELKLSNTRAAETYGAFKEMVDPAQIHMGVRKEEGEELLWLIAPSPDGEVCAVEFAEPNAATFIYHTAGDFTRFAKQLNRALEAIDFKREAIWLPDGDLKKPGYTHYYMAVKRNPALQFVRAQFVGRVIHHSMEAWKAGVLTHFKGPSS